MSDKPQAVMPQEERSPGEPRRTESASDPDAARRESATAAAVAGFVDGSRVATLLVDGDLRIRTATPAIGEFFGLDREAESLGELARTIGCEELATAVGRALAAGAGDERQLRRPDGHRYFLRTMPCLDPPAPFAVVTLVDLAGVRHLAAGLRLRERAIESATDGILITDAQQPDHPIVYANEAFERLTGYRAAEIRGRNCRFLQADDRDQPARHEIRAALAAGREVTVLLRNYKKHGAMFWNQLRLIPIRDEDDVVTHFVGIQNDVSERQSTESEYRRAQRAAEEASRTKSEFLATMSHEIRTPINAIFGLAQLLLQSDLPARERGYAEIIESSTDGLRQLIDGILDFSKVEAGKMTLEAQDFRLGDVVREVIELLEPNAKTAGIALALEIDDELDHRWLSSDPWRLRQVLINLVGNAVKFTHQGEVRLEVEPEAAPPGAAPPEAAPPGAAPPAVAPLAVAPPEAATLAVRFTLRDTGIGMSPEIRSRLFAPFTQADPSTSRQYGGTGLGLAICQQIVGLMGGKIEVESEPGAGSTFTFTALFQPAQEPQPRARPKPAPAVEAQRRPRDGFRILLAEDNPVNQLVSVQQLKHLGYRVDAFDNGRQALEALGRERYDLVLMDCQMPELDGYQATQRIRERETGERVPIVALTAHAMKGDREKCIAAGMDDYIAKPYREETLDAVLTSWLAVERRTSPS